MEKSGKLSSYQAPGSMQPVTDGETEARGPGQGHPSGMSDSRPRVTPCPACPAHWRQHPARPCAVWNRWWREGVGAGDCRRGAPCRVRKRVLETGRLRGWETQWLLPETQDE